MYAENRIQCVEEKWNVIYLKADVVHTTHHLLEN